MRAALLAVAVLLVACSPGGGAEGGGTEGGGEHVVPLRVVEGPAGGVLAFAQVHVAGSGPYLFALDTGAARTAIDARLARELGLESTGRSERLTGIAGAERAEIFRVAEWRLGDVQLPAIEVAAISFPHPGDGGPTLRGLLGSDVLSRFSAVTVDYEDGTLSLAEPAG